MAIGLVYSLQIRDHFSSSSGAERLRDLSRGRDEESGAVGAINVDVVIHPEPRSPLSKKMKPTSAASTTTQNSSTAARLECDTVNHICDNDSDHDAGHGEDVVRARVGAVSSRPDGRCFVSDPDNVA